RMAQSAQETANVGETSTCPETRDGRTPECGVGEARGSGDPMLDRSQLLLRHEGCLLHNRRHRSHLTLGTSLLPQVDEPIHVPEDPKRAVLPRAVEKRACTDPVTIPPRWVVEHVD